MMRTFRGMAKWLMVVMAVTFFGWLVFDVGANLSGRGATAQPELARVDGQKIDATSFYGAVRNAQEQQRRTNGSAPTSLEDQKALEDAVLEDLVQQVLLQKELRRRGIRVTDEEIIAAARNSPPPEVQQIPEFQTEGKFDFNKYQRYLAANADPNFLQALESRYRQEIPRLKLYEELASGVYVPTAKLWRMFQDQNDSVTAMFALIQPENYLADSAVNVTEERSRAYYQEHKDEFHRPAYAYLSFVALPRQANGKDSAAALDSANSVRRLAAQGTDFADLAKRFSSDSASAAKGGDLGEAPERSMIPLFEKAALALKPGQVSQPVLTEFGYHIIKLESRDAKKKTYRARHILIPIGLAGAHRDQVEARADSLDRLAAEQQDHSVLDSVARKLALPVSVAPPLAEGTRLQLGRFLIPDASVWAFKARAGETSPVIETDQAYFVFRLDSLRAEGVPSYEKIQNDVRRATAKNQKWTAVRAIAGEMAQEIKAGATLKSAADKRKVPVTTFGPFIRGNPPVQISDALPVIGAAFGLTVGQAGGPYETESGIYFVQPLAKKLADSTKFASQLDKERLQVMQAARQDRVRQVLASLREGATVTDRRKDLEKAQRDAEENPQPAAAQLPRGRRF